MRREMKIKLDVSKARKIGNYKYPKTWESKLARADANITKVITGQTGIGIDKKCRYGFPLAFLITVHNEILKSKHNYTIAPHACKQGTPARSGPRLECLIERSRIRVPAHSKYFQA